MEKIGGFQLLDLGNVESTEAPTVITNSEVIKILKEYVKSIADGSSFKPIILKFILDGDYSYCILALNAKIQIDNRYAMFYASSNMDLAKVNLRFEYDITNDEVDAVYYDIAEL